MRILIAISSCQRDVERGYNQAIRDTWVPRLAQHNIDYKFFIGSSVESELPTPEFEATWEVESKRIFVDYRAPTAPPLPSDFVPRDDEVVLDVPDTYKGLSFKTKEGHRYALQHGYDFVFQCFTDTYIIPHRLVKSGFEKFDYSGSKIANEHGVYAAGGSGYWLSAKACGLLIAEPVTHFLEDAWVGQVMRKHNIPFVPNVRYDNWNNLPSNKVLTKHLVFSRARAGYTPELMHRCHAIFNPATRHNFTRRRRG